ncbi:hypothetical protein MKI84_07230 [Ancylobacter sp. A5.8]|uniref:hypothetical protein n=1 Tax=Ancylobacter gelatini TaxID=2919920 RepID=UPI001F4DA166|nr:hypothetical protein [Ancylobacter gelatini]MCJ8142707.1 hypothetical protein [Ancylobacter gelatini]
MNEAAPVSAESAVEGQQSTGEATPRRLVLFLPGHDPTDMDYHHGRFAHQAQRFASLWSFGVEVSGRIDDGAAPLARWDVRTHGPNWRQETEYGILRWEDIVVELDDRPNHVRLWRGFAALIEFLINGTAGRYVKASPRYGGFFFFPFVIIALFAAAGALAGGIAAALAAPFVPTIAAVLLGALVAAGVFMGLFHQPGRRWRLHQALDDWDVARQYLRGEVAILDKRLDRFADIVIEKLRSGAYGEILLVGHSLGATLMLGVLDRVLDREPSLAAGPVRLSLLTCGATIPKLALHPQGERVRRQAARVAGAKGIHWVEYQARHDAINFYKFHPVTLTRSEFDMENLGAPVLRNANIKTMLTPEKLRKLRWSTMRIHYQFMLANERPASYDYFMFALGPIRFSDLTYSPDGPIGHFAPDGSRRDAPN